MHEDCSPSSSCAVILIPHRLDGQDEEVTDTEELYARCMDLAMSQFSQFLVLPSPDWKGGSCTCACLCLYLCAVND